MRPARTAITSNLTSAEASSGGAASQSPAARRMRPILTASIISRGSPKPSPLFDFTSTNASIRPRRTTRSSSAPPSHRLWSRTRYPRRRYQRAARTSASFLGGGEGCELFVREVRTRAPGAAVDLAWPSFTDDARVRRRDVPDMGGEAVTRVHRVGRAHIAVACHLRDDGGGRD